MQIVIRSSFDDKELEKEIQNAVKFAEQNNYYLDDVRYSTCYVADKGGVLRSALLMFEEYNDEDYENYEEEDDSRFRW